MLNLNVFFQTGQSMHSLSLEVYGGSARNIPPTTLSPPYSNHSPTHSNHTNSPQTYIGNYFDCFVF